ncbi:MAG: 16S rRNA (cytosine(1402)-N(4))-methyltransferase RsmH [Candidatus Shapirobacteria bacterium]|nr:16S rRNA (cytosine(1402)-N(4))-methyltransferase RsmH [Candidatus Shapirobacteria bacterium]
MNFHTPVLLKESINNLSIETNGVYIDATLGHGGHTIEILQRGGIVYGFDQDPVNLNLATSRIKELNLDSRFTPVNQNFTTIKKFVNQKIGQKIDGLIADLGLSQSQQTATNRGFSFNDSQSIDMRLNPKSQTLTAEEIINTYSFDDLYQIFTKFGQELYSKPLILHIIRQRQKSPIKTGERLANIIREYYQEHHIKTKVDPATKIFLSLRIAVNQENTNLQQLLEQSLDIVKSDGNISIITFHSGEDRIVKQFLTKHSSEIIPQKPIKPTFQEIKNNPLSRSSILRSYKIV